MEVNDFEILLIDVTLLFPLGPTYAFSSKSHGEQNACETYINVLLVEAHVHDVVIQIIHFGSHTLKLEIESAIPV